MPWLAGVLESACFGSKWSLVKVPQRLSPWTSGIAAKGGEARRALQPSMAQARVLNFLPKALTAWAPATSLLECCYQFEEVMKICRYPLSTSIARVS